MGGGGGGGGGYPLEGRGFKLFLYLQWEIYRGNL